MAIQKPSDLLKNFPSLFDLPEDEDEYLENEELESQLLKGTALAQFGTDQTGDAIRLTQRWARSLSRWVTRAVSLNLDSVLDTDPDEWGLAKEIIKKADLLVVGGHGCKYANNPQTRLWTSVFNRLTVKGKYTVIISEIDLGTYGVDELLEVLGNQGRIFYDA